MGQLGPCGNHTAPGLDKQGPEEQPCREPANRDTNDPVDHNASPNIEMASEPQMFPLRRPDNIQ